MGGVAASGMVSLGVQGGILGGATSGAASGLAGGFIFGGAMTVLPGGNGDILGGAIGGAITGFATGVIIGGITGGIFTPKGHSIWTGNPLRQPATTIQGITKGVNIAPENFPKSELSLRAPVQVYDTQPQINISIKNIPDGGLKLVPQFSNKTIDDAIRLTMRQKELHIFQNRIHPKSWLNNLSSKMGGNENVIRQALQNANGRIFPNAQGIFNTSVNVGGINFIIRGYINNGVPIINSVFIP